MKTVDRGSELPADSFAPNNDLNHPQPSIDDQLDVADDLIDEHDLLSLESVVFQPGGREMARFFRSLSEVDALVIADHALLERLKDPVFADVVAAIRHHKVLSTLLRAWAPLAT